MPTLSQDRDVFVLALFWIAYKGYWGVKGVTYETDFQVVEKERTPKFFPPRFMVSHRILQRSVQQDNRRSRDIPLNRLTLQAFGS